ncbi:MAG: Ribosomal RNA small subunit methyltransferase I [Fimbriimonadaceae bacterium]|nr:Ribosomal RNA small subunit methyltransferase I [Fimbriimonadaceae bacterium]
MAAADFWIVEDSRISAKLAQHLGIRKPMTVLNDHSGSSIIERIAERISAGESAVLMTDAGTPGISDPGAMLVDRLYDLAVPIDSIPGPSAVVVALSLSGFFAQRFAFLGYLPRRTGDIVKEVQPYESSTMTLVLFESPYRFRTVLEVIYQVLGKRRVAICRELTKRHQQIWRGTLDSLPSEAQVPAKGEFTIVIEGMRKSGVQSSNPIRRKGSHGGDGNA